MRDGRDFRRPLPYWDRAGIPMEPDAWRERFEHDPAYRRVRFTSIELDGVPFACVSTAWFGFDLGLERLLRPDREPLPLIFETAVFAGGQTDVFARSATEAEAVAAHDDAVTVASAIVGRLVAPQLPSVPVSSSASDE